MAEQDKEIGDLTEVAEALAADIWHIVQSGNSRKVTAQKLAAYVLTTLGSNLKALDGLTGAADQMPYFTGAGAMDVAAVSAFARSLLDDADAAAALETLGFSAFVRTLVNDIDANAFLNTLGAGTAGKALLAAADAGAAQDALGATAIGKALLAAVDVAAGKTAIGLANVDNTKDADKPISTEQAAALAKRVRVDAAQVFTAAEKGQAIANIGGGVLAGFRNKLINPNFSVRDRAASATANGSFFITRWKLHLASGAASAGIIEFLPSQTQKPPPHRDQYGARIQISSAGNVGISQFVEGVRTLAGKKVTLTFYARWVITEGVTLSGVTFNQVFGSGGAPSATVHMPYPFADGALPADNEWRKFSVVADIPPIDDKTIGSNANDYLQVLITFSGTGGVDITRLSLVEGDASAENDPFAARHIQQEQALCQRYYERRGLYSSMYGTAGVENVVDATFVTTKRAIPTVTWESSTVSNGQGLRVSSPDTMRFLAAWAASANGQTTLNSVWRADAEL